MVFTNVVNPRSHVSRKNEYQRTLVKRGATLGANSTILCGVTIGQYAFVAAGAVVTHDVPDYALMMGVPAKQVGWMCQCGTRLETPAGEPEAEASGSPPAQAGERLVCEACVVAYEKTGAQLRRVS
jgi:UDP-2-acetamido-3-amino-2,3-dideoxy-glucuronate N-acetyltransferase